jgi:uncharacterized protein YdeI (YjbR/CyaY-like superfamily)
MATFVGKYLRVSSCAEWREWLQKHHLKQDRVSLLLYKKQTGLPTITHRESLLVAICFGWIDTTVKTLDEDKYTRTFVKRGLNSRWSTNTISYAEDMITQGKMSAFGMEMFQLGKRKPVFDSNALKQIAETPEELLKALQSHSNEAVQNFEAFAPSYKRTFINWVLSAKRTETRTSRIEMVVQKAVANDKFLFNNQKTNQKTNETSRKSKRARKEKKEEEKEKEDSWEEDEESE